MNHLLKISNFIGGKSVEPLSGKYLDNYEPAIGQVYSLIPDSDQNDVQVAVDAARKAFPSWSAMSNDDRSEWLMKIAQGIEDRLDEFAAAESKDNGKPVSLAKSVDIPRAVSNFRFFAHALTQFSSESHFMQGIGINYTLR